MARPCGCAGSCGCTLVGIDGVRTTGSGTARDPLMIGLSSPLGGNGCEAVMDCVGGSVGPGLAYNDALNSLTTKVSGDSGNSITYGADGGLFSTGGGGGGGTGGVTIASLPTANLIGGSYGAGSTQLPEGPLRTYQVGMEMETSMLHVPVRRLGDYWLVAAHYRSLGSYDPFLTSETTQTFDVKQWKRLVYKPSGSLDSLSPSGKTILGIVKRNIADQVTSISNVMFETLTLTGLKAGRWYKAVWQFMSSATGASNPPNGLASIHLSAVGASVSTADPVIRQIGIINQNVTSPGFILEMPFTVPTDGTYTLGCSANSGGSPTLNILASGAANNVNAANKRAFWVEEAGPQTGNAFDPLAGYFGLSEPDRGQQGPGGTVLADVLRTCAHRKVLYLEIKDVGLSAGDTNNPEQTAAMLNALLQQWGYSQTVIVGSEFPLTASQADITLITSGLQTLATNGIAVAAHLTSKAMMDAVTPAALVSAGIGWVFLPAQAAMDNQAQATAYKTAGLQVMLHGAYRQAHYELQRTLAFRGALSTDPYYVQGWQNQFRYRKLAASWSWGTADYGRHGYAGDNMTTHRTFDGYVENGQGGKLVIRPDSIPPPDTSAQMQSGYYVLQGEQCPIYDAARDPAAVGNYGSPTNYDIEVGFSWSNLVTDRDRWMSVFFGVPDDSAILDYTRANANTRGYMFGLSQSGLFTYHRYDGIPWTGAYPPPTPPAQYDASWDSTWGTIVPNTEYRVLVQVRAGAITVGRLGAGSTVLNGRTFNAATGGGDRWRGPYFHLGRHFWSVSDSATCRFHNLVTRTY